mmetsp:Transcript_16115/g.19127  ORF Transcript_16115/g.19127 Transcript_16115/m.19127 type:complete len:152 (+) Transcript_16115:1079-1534(+)
MNRKVRIVLELKLLLLLPGQRHRLICTFLAMHFTGGDLLRLEAFLVASTARWLPTLALSNDVFLCFFKFTAVHVLGCIGCPRSVCALIHMLIASISSALDLVGGATLFFVNDALLGFPILLLVVAAARRRILSVKILISTPLILLGQEVLR